MGKIKITVLEGLNADDVLKLHAGGFFSAQAVLSVPLPPGVTGQQAVLAPVAPVASGYDANAREAVERAEAAQLAAVEAIRQQVEAKADGTSEGLYPDGLFPHEPPKAEQKPKRRSKVTPDGVEPVVSEAAPGAPSDIDPEKLLGFTKLRDLIQYIVDTGTPVAGVAAFCEQVREQVPLLQRISDIPERVNRTLVVMGHAGV